MPPVVVVGGGISGIACAQALNSRGLSVRLIDRGRTVGGRMASRAIRDSGTDWDGHIVDIGASYFTAQDEEFAALVENLVDEGIARAWTDTFHVASPDGIDGVKTGPMRYTATRGLRTIIEHLAARLPNTEVISGREVSSVSHDGGVLTVDGDEAAAVAVCVPGPQATPLFDQSAPSLSAVIRATGQVLWEPVIAVTAVFDAPTWIDFDAIFVNDDPVLTWIANDGSRRGTDAPVLVAHVQPVFAARHLAQPNEVLPAALGAIGRVLTIADHPVWADVQRWTYAKPMAASDDSHFIDEHLNLGLAGDAWAGGPRVETAWLSGHRLGHALADRQGAS
jgi:renalase